MDNIVTNNSYFDMEETINNIIIEHFGVSVFVILVLIVGIISVSIWCHNVWLKVKKIDDLPCDSHKDKMIAHDNAVTRIETSITYLTKAIDNAMNTFQQQNIKTDGFTQTHSPLSITKQGWAMVERLGVKKMFEENWPRVRELIDNGVADKNAYDIDDFCVKQAVVFPEKFLTADNLSVLKDDAFKNGLTLTSYMKVIAVMSRDEYLKEHGINIEDIAKETKS